MARKRLKKRTFSEFMSWLEGVEAMQGNEWAPEPSQWKAIREMLDNVVPDKVEVQIQPPQVVQPPNEWNVPTMWAPNPQQPDVQTNNTQPVVPQDSAFDKQPPKRQVPSGMNKPTPKVRSTKKEEMIDTSNGNYESDYL